MNPVKVGIVGASGYSGEGLVRLLLRHPGVDLSAVTSRQYAGQSIAQVFPKFANYPGAQSLRFSEPKAELLARTARIFSWPCHTGSRRNLPRRCWSRAARSLI